MAKSPLFSDGPATDMAYENIRSAHNFWLSDARKHCEELWDLFEPYADAQFLTEIRSNFHSRYWEMYLGAYFISSGYNVAAPKPGPDIGIDVAGRRVWFEAVSPSRGAEGHPDQVPQKPFDGTVQEVPADKINLRYLNCVHEKYCQYLKWIDRQTIGCDDAFVVAINPRRLGFEYADTTPPRILQVALGLGPLYVALDRKTLKVVDSGFQFQSAIAKGSGISVDTAVFLQEKYAGLNGLLCSRVDAVNRPEALGEDFQFVANPRARNPLPGNFRLHGTYYRVEQVNEGYEITPE
jgi:hypothetical protein